MTKDKWEVYAGVKVICNKEDICSCGNPMKTKLAKEIAHQIVHEHNCFNELVEPVGIAFVNLESVTDFFPWKHKLPTEQK